MLGINAAHLETPRGGGRRNPEPEGTRLRIETVLTGERLPGTTLDPEPPSQGIAQIRFADDAVPLHLAPQEIGVYLQLREMIVGSDYRILDLSQRRDDPLPRGGLVEVRDEILENAREILRFAIYVSEEPVSICFRQIRHGRQNFGTGSDAGNADEHLMQHRGQDRIGLEPIRISLHARDRINIGPMQPRHGVRSLGVTGDEIPDARSVDLEAIEERLRQQLLEGMDRPLLGIPR